MPDLTTACALKVGPGQEVLSPPMKLWIVLTQYFLRSGGDTISMSETTTKIPAITRRQAQFLGFGIATATAVAIYAPILYHMILVWKNDANYSHGFLIVPLAIHFAWEKKKKLKSAVLAQSGWGVAFLIAATLSLSVGRLGVELMSMRVAFVLTLIGLVLLLLGKEIFRILVFPLFFLFLMIPLPQSIVNIVAFPLQLIAAKMAVASLQTLGIPTLLEGNIIHLANTQLFVAEACSGLRSLMALITLGVVFAYFFRKNILERSILVASTIPIAILVNAFRVGLTGFLTYRIDPKFAEGAIHEWQGLFTFGIAFACLLGEAWAIEKIITRYHSKQTKCGLRP